MNKIVVIGAVVGAALALSACTTVKPTPEVVNKIQSETRRICKFIPTAVTIASLLRVTSFAQVLNIATDICAAVVIAPKSEGPGAPGPRLRGVVLKGHYVK